MLFNASRRTNLDINGRLGWFDMIVHKKRWYRDIENIHRFFVTLF